MKPERKRESKKIRNLVAGYNMIANLFWSVLNLVPISIFCYQHMTLKLFLIAMSACLLTLFIPKSFFHLIQLSRTTSVYKRIGVNFINKFAQNGEIINTLIRRKFPQYKTVSASRQSVERVLAQTYLFEKFHFTMFTVFTFVIVYALLRNSAWWAVIIFINNLIYNIYPNLLQQYIRLKLTRGRAYRAEKIDL